MRIVIVGAGTVGTSIARYLTREGHEVVMMDKSATALARLEDLDVQTFPANACDPDNLLEAAVDLAHVFLAVTNHDETNLIAAFAARKMGCQRVVARVRSPFYYKEMHVPFRSGLNISMFISPEVETAEEFLNFIRTPDALATVTLAQGRVQLRTIKMSPESEFAGRALKDLRLPEGVLVAATRHEGIAHIARGNTVLHGEDRVTLMGLPAILDDVSRRFHMMKPDDESKWVVIAGAGETGLVLAKGLEHQGKQVTLIERDRARADVVSREVGKSTRILHGDATEANFLKQEHIGKAAYFISAMGDDENNIMSTMLAKELGVRKTACVIDRPDYIRIVEKIGIDVAISPRFVAANRILAMVKRGRIRSVTLIEDGELEINEYEALSTSPVTGQPLKDVPTPDHCLFGAIARTGRVHIPRGDFIIHPGDTVITVAKPEATDKLDVLFAGAPKSTTVKKQ
ncbi:MAG: Trk system potassium transporter TrkA [Candidatus Sumerlaeia bacterium]|nr:Trk system potassium transporter TrkA [Candidatus Sumerlaeia bacterium]